MTREHNARALQAAANLGVIDETVAHLMLGDRRRLGWMANRCAGAQGEWRLSNIEGRLPRDLRGVLYRIAPGQKFNHGVKLMDFFDGDAFVSSYRFDGDGVTLRAGFVGTPERRRELAAGQMLYNEFGTLAPNRRNWYSFGVHWKNPPNVNVIQWDNRLLGLSEGGHPTAIDPVTLAYQERWDFHGTLPASCAFTAHPRFDVHTGAGYAYGYTKSPWPSLCVFRMETDGKLTELYRLPQKHYFMVHDMLLTEHYVVLVIPPVKLNLLRCLLYPETLAENLRYFEDEPTRILVLDREGAAEPREIEFGPNMVFHHGNAHEQDGKIVFHSLMYPDGRILDLVRCWSREPPPSATSTRLMEIEIDPSKGTVCVQELDEELELPRFDPRRTADATRFLYATRGSAKTPGDPYGAEVLKLDLVERRTAVFAADTNQCAFGEPVFVPRPGSADEDGGWLLTLGYCARRDETGLEVVDARSMHREARVWTGTHLPLGFHGNFYPAV